MEFFFQKKKSLRGLMIKALRFATLLVRRATQHPQRHTFLNQPTLFSSPQTRRLADRRSELDSAQKRIHRKQKRLTTAQGLPNALENTRITHQYGWKPYFFNRNACVPGRTAGGSLHWRCKNTSLGYTFHPKTRFRRGLEEKPFLINRNIQFPF